MSILNSCQNDPIELILKKNNDLKGEMLDPTLKFVGASTYDDVFYYSYTVNTCRKDQSEFTNQVFEKTMAIALNDQINELEEFKIIGDNNYDIIFKYDCDDGQAIAEVYFKFENGLFEYQRSDSEFNEAVDIFFDKL